MTATLCRDCHAAIHATFSNKELERTYSTTEALLSHEAFRKLIAFIASQDPGGRIRTKLTKGQRASGRRR